MPLLPSLLPDRPDPAADVDVARKRRRLDSAATSCFVIDSDDTDDDASDDDDDFALFDTAHKKRKPPAPNPLSSPPDASGVGEVSALRARTCSGKGFHVFARRPTPVVPYEQLIASRSSAAPGRVQRSYYGIDIYTLMDEAKHVTEVQHKQQSRGLHADAPVQTVEGRSRATTAHGSNRLWTDKYRARRFTDLVGDERTHRLVLSWLKGWDPVVFPGSARRKVKSTAGVEGAEGSSMTPKLLLLCGPPGLGKTTLAHVCAQQAGYEVQEINASDERSKDVVRGRIRDMLGTENVRGVNIMAGTGAKVRQAGKPVCVVVDEVDGVVGGGPGGEGGFVKALVDLVSSDGKKRDQFRMRRPLILICNDPYHPSLRLLRQRAVATTIHVRKPPISAVVSRLLRIFEKEGIPADLDAVRRLCQATWGVSSRNDGAAAGGGAGEGDIRGVMVVGEWVARKLMAEANGDVRLTRKWIEDRVINDLSHEGGAARGLGGAGTREVVERVFTERAGFSASALAGQATKRTAMDSLEQMVNTAGDTDRIVTDCFTTFAERPFQDDTRLSKPSKAHDWLHLYDSISTMVHSGQEWELAKYLSTPVLGFHHLFASSRRSPFGQATAARRGYGLADEDGPDDPAALLSGPGAPYRAAERTRANLASLAGLQSGLSLPLARVYRSPAEVSTELIPYALRMLSPDVKPVVVRSSSAAMPTASVRRASEKALVMRAVNAMAAVGVRFEKSRVDFGADERRVGMGEWIMRMEPPLDALAAYPTLSDGRGNDEKVRYAVRQIMDMEFKKESLKMELDARKRRGGATTTQVAVKMAAASLAIKAKAPNDFFGRAILKTPQQDGASERRGKTNDGDIWVNYREGFTRAVRRPISLSELLAGL